MTAVRPHTVNVTDAKSAAGEGPDLGSMSAMDRILYRSKQLDLDRALSAPRNRGASDSRRKTIKRSSRKPCAAADSGPVSPPAGDVPRRLATHSQPQDSAEPGSRNSSDGCDTDLDTEDRTERPGGSLRTVYLDACRRHGVVPASYFMRHMDDDRLEMKHHGLGPAGTRAVTTALANNTTVLNLNLTDNWLGADGGDHVCDMLQENCYITHLNVSDNRLSRKFAKRFLGVLSSNNTLTHITLSGNNLDDGCAAFVAAMIMNTHNIEYFNLSHNFFGEMSGIVLGPAIAENGSMKELNLSWNSIRRKGAVCLAQGLKLNATLQNLDLSWNGFGTEGAKALGDALKVNSTLEIIDISNNRITTEGAVLLGKGMVANTQLKTLKLGKNPMQSAGCYAICAALLKNSTSAIRQLDFSDIQVNKDFHDLFTKVKEEWPDLKLRHGGDGVPKKPKARVHPMVKLKNYIDKNKLRLVDFFNKFDKDHSMSVTREEFTEGIYESGIKLTVEEIGQLLDELDRDGDGEINYSELVIGHQDFTEKEKKMATTIISLK